MDRDFCWDLWKNFLQELELFADKLEVVIPPPWKTFNLRRHLIVRFVQCELSWMILTFFDLENLDLILVIHILSKYLNPLL